MQAILDPRMSIFLYIGAAVVQVNLDIYKQACFHIYSMAK